MKILLDLDGVVRDFTAAVLGHFPTLARERLTDFDYSKIVGAAEWEMFLNVACSEGFVTDLPRISGTRKFVAGLRHCGHSVRVVTSPLKDAPTWAYETEQWCTRHLGIYRECITHSSFKGDIQGDVMIDDGLHNVEPWLANNPRGIAILVDQPWNRARAAPRVSCDVIRRHAPDHSAAIGATMSPKYHPKTVKRFFIVVNVLLAIAVFAASAFTWPTATFAVLFLSMALPALWFGIVREVIDWVLEPQRRDEMNPYREKPSEPPRAPRYCPEFWRRLRVVVSAALLACAIVAGFWADPRAAFLAVLGAGTVALPAIFAVSWVYEELEMLKEIPIETPSTKARAAVEKIVDVLAPPSDKERNRVLGAVRVLLGIGGTRS